MSFNGNMYETDEGLELTTKGQIHTHNASNNVGLGVSGNNDYVLVEDSSTPTGLAWKLNAHSSVTPSSTTTFTNKSIDFGTNTMTSTLAQLDTALGTTGTADATTFLRGDNSWASAGGGGFSSGNRIAVATSGAQTGSSTSYASVTSLTTTLSSNSGVAFATYSLNGYMSSTSYNARFRFDNGGSGSEATQIDASRDMQVTDGLAITSLTGQTLQIQYIVDGGSVTINSLNVGAGNRNGHMEILEIS